MAKVYIEKGKAGDLGDAWSYADGKPHDLVYGGKKAHEYRCKNCGKFIDKAQLKEMTDA